MSLVEPPKIRSFTPTHLVILAGIEVGIFTSWYNYLLISIFLCAQKKLRLSSSSNQPPFQNGFKLWGDAVVYYTNNFNDGKIHIIKSRSGTNLNPIVVPSTAPTPHRPRRRVEYKGRGPLKKKGVASDQSVTSGSVTAAITAPGGTQSVSKSNKKGKQSTAKTKIVKGKKRARVNYSNLDSDTSAGDYDPLYDEDEPIVRPSFEGIVVDISDFDTPSPASSPVSKPIGL